MSQNFKITDIPTNERPREKMFAYGPEMLTNEELLAVILRTGTKNENALMLSYRVLESVDGLEGLFNSSFSELMKINGVKKAKASQILAVCELYKRFKTTNIKRKRISNPKDVADVIMDELMFLKQEVLEVIMLDTKNMIISKKQVFKGGLNSSLVHPREIFKEALKVSAASIIICHNHPSGDITPSKEDVNITLRIKECGKIIGIELLDHIIIGSNKFISLKEQSII